VRAAAVSNWSDLARRAASGVLLAAVALALAWWGGYPFALFWTAAAVLVLGEWEGIVSRGAASSVVGPPLGALAVAGAIAAALWGSYLASVVLLVAGAAAVAALHRGRPAAVLGALGVPYAGAMAIPIIVLRDGSSSGLVAVLFVFAAVWGSDIMAYFFGRTFGGPKLWPSVSPKKTWSGFLGGTLCGAAAAAACALVAGFGEAWILILVGIVLAVLSQGGDLLESALKRRFGAKDAGTLIPGHGGLMDRLDGFVAASLAALLIGLARNAANPAAGLLSW
jgi:phosphatidate cytidylyltransferase